MSVAFEGEAAVSKPQRDTPPPTKIERWGAATGHASLFLVGFPITFILLSPPWSLLLCPVVPYLIGRSFRRRSMPWGAYQGMQASVIQLLILILAIFTVLAANIPRLSDAFLLFVFLLSLYSLWGALETWLGYDFRYPGISDLLEHVSHRNMGRREVRRGWFGVGSREEDEKGR